MCDMSVLIRIRECEYIWICHLSFDSLQKLHFYHKNDKPSSIHINMAWVQIAVRFLLSGGLIVGASELAKKNDIMGALLASLPLISIFAMILLYNDTGDSERVATFSKDIFWLVIPSLVLFLSLPILLHRGIDFWLALSMSIVLTILAYALGIKMASGSNA